MCLTIDLHENLVQMPFPARVRPRLLHPFSANFSGEHWAETVPPMPNRFVADIHTALVQQVLDIPQRKRKSNIEYKRQANDLGAAMKLLERIAFCHPLRLRNRPARLKTICSDKTPQRQDALRSSQKKAIINKKDVPRVTAPYTKNKSHLKTWDQTPGPNQRVCKI